MTSSSFKRVGYLTDVEGNWEYFNNYIKISSIIEYDSQGNLTFKSDNTIFVFGGDVCDKGNGTIRITRLLVALKKKFPERVILILGNRDINKLRWTSELAPSEIVNLENVPGPYWVKKEAQVTPKQYLDKLPVDSRNKKKDINTTANRIRWMLDATMGSAGDFERRRAELAILASKTKTEITDEQVASSYINSVKPSAEMYEFLSLGQLAFINEGTIYVHGGLNKANLGYVPFSKVKYSNLVEWVEALNAWYRAEFQDWILKPRWEYAKTLFRNDKFDATIQGVPPLADYEDRSKWAARGAHRLLDYVLPSTKGSVVYTHMFSRFNDCQAVDNELEQNLISHGIRRIISGHQPHGNAPAVTKDDEFESIDADCSYSDMSKEDNRGEAVSELVIEGKFAHIQGTLHDGRRIQYSLSWEKGEGDPYVGRRVPLPTDKEGNSYWVKAKLRDTPPDGKQYYVCRVTGFVVVYDHMSAAQLDDFIYGFKSELELEDVNSHTVNGKTIPITKLPGVTTRVSDVTNHQFFVAWIEKIANNPELNLERIEIQSVDYDLTGLRIRFIKIHATIRNKKGELQPGVVLLRGNSLAVFCVLVIQEGKKLVLGIKHARIPIGAHNHLEIPVGMEDKNPIGVMHELLQNECNINLENFVSKTHDLSDKVIYTAPGNSDLGVKFVLIEIKITAEQVNELISKPRKKDSTYETVLIPLEELENQSQDGNTIIAARLYELYIAKKQKGRIENANDTKSDGEEDEEESTSDRAEKRAALLRTM